MASRQGMRQLRDHAARNAPMAAAEAKEGARRDKEREKERVFQAWLQADRERTRALKEESWKASVASDAAIAREWGCA